MTKPQVYQGDITFIPLEEFGFTATDVSRDNRLRAHDNRLLIQEGEITGHHHGVWFVPKPVYLRDDALAHADAKQMTHDVLARASAGEFAPAKLYRDDALIVKIVKSGALDAAAPVIGFLIADEDVTIRHASSEGAPTNEHSDVRVSRGGHVVLGKREFTAGDIRRVQD